MINSRNMNKVVAVFVAFTILLSAFIVYAANTFDTAYVPEYQKRLFNGEVVTINIEVDSGDWQSLIDNASQKEYISANLVINGEVFSSVGIRTKGNSSLSQAGSSDTSRYSLQFKMNHHQKGQTYYGLDAFCVNNMMGDATYMKDYIAYDIMNYIGVETPLTGYAKVMVNGEDYGFGLMLERYEKAFLDRAYNTSAGQLYNVKIQMGQRDNFAQFGQAIEDDAQNNQTNGNTSENNTYSDTTNSTSNRRSTGGIGDFSNMGGMGGFGGFGGSNGGNLAYTDDELSSYSSIFDNAEFRSVTEEDMKRVVTAIKNLNEGTELEKYWDVDGVLRYLAAHTVVVNLDSYVSSMQQNYYIYENDGKITILPWDYGLSFGGFQSGNASSVVNFPIDTPVSGVNVEDRPLISKLFEVEEYKERYHEYLRQIVEGYFESGLFEKTILQQDEKINEYVKNDVSAYYTHEQYEASLPVFIELGRLRAASIAGQLDGTIPSTTSGQYQDSSALIDSSGINLTALGSMMGGGRNMQGNIGGMGMGGRGNSQRNIGNGNQNSSENQMTEGFEGQMPEGFGGQMPDMSNGNSENGFGTPSDMWSGFQDIDMSAIQSAMEIIGSSEIGDLSDEQIAQLNEIGISNEMIEQFSQMFRMGFPGGGNGFNANPNNPNTNPSSAETVGGVNWVLYGVLFVLLFGSTVFIALYKRRRMSAY